MPTQPAYPASQHALWGQLLTRQRQRIADLACPQFQRGFAALGLTPNAIPRFVALSTQLDHLSGWTVHAVDGLLPEADFFGRLARREFPITWWLRDADQADYIVEPDLFHDLVGHLPMLTDPAVGDFIQAYGQAVTALVDRGETAAVTALTRLYWFTIEFGLVGTPGRPELYGAGLLSSFHESHWAIHAPAVDRCPADLIAMMRQAYAIDRPQPRYFVLPELDQLWRWTPPVLTTAARQAAQEPDVPVPGLA